MQTDPITLRVKGLVKVRLSPEIYMKIPAIAAAMSTTVVEARKKEYTFRGETTKEALQYYLLFKKNGVFEKTTVLPWPAISNLALQLGDTDFLQPKILDKHFPPLQEISDDHLVNFQEDVMIYYAEKYILRTFAFECVCGRDITANHGIKNETAWDYIKTQENNADKVFSLLGEVTFWNSKEFFTPNNLMVLLSQDRLKIKQVLLAGTDCCLKYFPENRNDIIDSFCNMDIRYRYLLLSETLFTYCRCKKREDSPFREIWKMFLILRPKFARVLWESMNREQLLNYGNIYKYKKQYNRMMKCSYEQLVEYICPQKEVDEKEIELREALRHRVRLNDAETDCSQSEIIAFRQRDLDNYLNLKKKQHKPVILSERIYNKSKFANINIKK